MRKALCLGLLFYSIHGNILAQEPSSSEQELSPSRVCAKGRIAGMPLMKTTVAHPAEDDYDMGHVRINLNLTNTTTTLSGDVTTSGKVVAASMPAYVFELNSQLTIDSVLFNNQSLSVATNGDVRTVTLPAALPQYSNFTVRVFYRGTATNGTGFFSTGIRNQSSPTWGNDVTYTMSEPYESKDWWPTKQSLTDKIDSADIWITVPAGLKAGSNGLLKAITPLPGNNMRYEWKTRYPMDYYLVSVAVASYIDYSYYVHFPGSNDSMLVQNFVYDNPQTLPFFKDMIDSVGGMIQYFSELYGRYPFWQEKYGHCMAPLSGGMEHQTMTTLGHFATTLSVHELGHQWFGDNVTCGSWKDIWLNEGFAAYTEYLYVEHFRGPSDAFFYMLNDHNSVLQQSDGSVYVDDTTNSGRIFDGRLTYDKGASIVHTLRFVFNNDSLFFQALRNYQNQYQGGTAVTEDFRQIAQQTLGQNLDTFFAQWIYGEGHPVYSATWNQSGNQVYVKLDQTTSHPSVSLYHTPIELQLYSLSGDTTIRVYNNQPSQVYTFTWNKQMATLFIDPNDWLLNGFGSILKDVNLGMGNVSQHRFKVYPNPARSAWQVTNLERESRLQLTDINGKLIWEGEADRQVTIPAEHLAPGIYLLSINDRQSSVTVKLTKQ